jgi:imidazolonepropionase-like amidohydrolase
MTRACVTLLVFCLVVARGLTQAVAPPQAPVTVIRGGTLIDGNGGAPVRDATIVIEGNRIHAVVGGNPAATPAGAHVIDASGKFIVPGLWDTHTHYRAWFPELLMTNGVTSVLGYAGGPWINAIAEGTRKRKVYGPRMFLSQGISAAAT